jgi:hypothetical protein
MANARHNVPPQWDFAKTGRMATTAFLVAAVILGVVVLLSIGYLSSQSSPERGKPQNQQQLR